MDEYITDQLVQKCEEELRDLVAPKCLDDVLMKLAKVFKETEIDEDEEKPRPKLRVRKAKEGPGAWFGDIYIDMHRYMVGNPPSGYGGSHKTARYKLLAHLIKNFESEVSEAEIKRVTERKTAKSANQLRRGIAIGSKDFFVERRRDNNVVYFSLTYRTPKSS